ncbi:MAG: WD40 repeat domain-containing protein [Ignavibacteria bacterium]|jgi:WD40 repeat protein
MKYCFYLICFLLCCCTDSNVGPDNELYLEVEEINSNVNNVKTVSVSYDGRYVMWAGNTNDIKVKGEKSLKGHISTINSLAFNDDKKLLLSGSNDNNIKLWDIETLTLLRTFSEHVTVTRDVKFTPDGKSVISAENNYIVYWRNAVDGFIGRLPLYGHTSTVTSVDISNDMTTIISGSSDKTIKVWNAESGDLIQTLTDHTSSIREVEFSPVLDRFASCSSDSTVRIWSLETLQQIKFLEGHIGTISSISYHPAGKYLAGGGTSSIIYIWNVESGEIIRSLETHTKTINAVSFSGNGNILVSGGADDKVIIWRNVFSPLRN